MELTATQQAALQRWHELGVSTPANPILQLAYELYLTPMGLKCKGLRYDALESLENAETSLIVDNPVFDPSLLEKTYGHYNLFEPLIPLLDRIEPIFNTSGTLEEFIYLKEDAITDPAVIAFQENHADALFDLSDMLIDCAKLYVDGALESLIREDPQSDKLCELFNKNPRHYAEVIFEIFTRPAPQV